MTVRKLSISVPPEIERMIKAAAARQGVSVSAWVAAAAERQAAEIDVVAEGQRAARELVVEYEAQHGPIPERVKQRVDDALAELGLTGDAPPGRLPSAG
ncbi:MAG TPA: hypothetical protein VGL39_00470 [Jatrophihabitantaceae bacterium]|jgi:hypothetical protein